VTNPYSGKRRCCLVSTMCPDAAAAALLFLSVCPNVIVFALSLTLCYDFTAKRDANS